MSTEWLATLNESNFENMGDIRLGGCDHLTFLYTGNIGYINYQKSCEKLVSFSNKWWKHWSIEGLKMSKEKPQSNTVTTGTRLGTRPYAGISKSDHAIALCLITDYTQRVLSADENNRIADWLIALYLYRVYEVYRCRPISRSSLNLLQSQYIQFSVRDRYEVLHTVSPLAPLWPGVPSFPGGPWNYDADGYTPSREKPDHELSYWGSFNSLQPNSSLRTWRTPFANWTFWAILSLETL